VPTLMGGSQSPSEIPRAVLAWYPLGSGMNSTVYSTNPWPVTVAACASTAPATIIGTERRAVAAREIRASMAGLLCLGFGVQRGTAWSMPPRGGPSSFSIIPPTFAVPPCITRAGVRRQVALGNAAPLW
jgi:hypothetical protein